MKRNNRVVLGQIEQEYCDLMTRTFLGYLYCISPLFRCRISPGLNFFRFTTDVIAPIVMISTWPGVVTFSRFSIPIFRLRRYHATGFSCPYGVILSPFHSFSPRFHAHLPALTVGAIPARAYVTLPSGSARDRIVTAVRTVPSGYSDDGTFGGLGLGIQTTKSCLLYTSDAADE